MATVLETLQATRERIVLELSTMSLKPSYSIDGQSVDHDGHRKALMEQLAKIEELIRNEAGPEEEVTLAVDGY